MNYGKLKVPTDYGYSISGNANSVSTGKVSAINLNSDYFVLLYVLGI